MALRRPTDAHWRRLARVSASAAFIRALRRGSVLRRGLPRFWWASFPMIFGDPISLNGDRDADRAEVGAAYRLVSGAGAGERWGEQRWHPPHRQPRPSRAANQRFAVNVQGTVASVITVL